MTSDELSAAAELLTKPIDFDHLKAQLRQLPAAVPAVEDLAGSLTGRGHRRSSCKRARSGMARGRGQPRSHSAEKRLLISHGRNTMAYILSPRAPDETAAAPMRLAA
jgi:hypothetical protein